MVRHRVQFDVHRAVPMGRIQPHEGVADVLGPALPMTSLIRTNRSAGLSVRWASSATGAPEEPSSGSGSGGPVKASTSGRSASALSSAYP